MFLLGDMRRFPVSCEMNDEQQTNECSRQSSEKRARHREVPLRILRSAGTHPGLGRSLCKLAGGVAAPVGRRIDTEVHMLSWALTFFVVAIIAAVLGFTSIAGAAAGIAKILFFVFLVLTLVALVGGALRGRPPV